MKANDMNDFENEAVSSEPPGFGDLMINIVLVIMFLMFMFMVNQGVQAIATQVDEELLQSLISSQEASIKENAARMTKMASDAKKNRERSAEEKRQLLATTQAAQAAADAAKEDAQEKQREGERRESELENKVSELENQISLAKSAKSLRIHVCIDCSASMGSSLERLKLTIASIMRTLPRTLTEVSIGMTAYRGHHLAELPIERVKSVDQDGGKSSKRVQNFVDRLLAEGGVANIDEAIASAMKKLDAFPDAPREVLIVIGDVSTREVSGGDDSVDEELIRSVASWTETVGKTRRVIGLYTGVAETDDEAFFKRLGRVSSSSTFSTDNTRLLELILTAAFAEEGTSHE